MLLDSCRTISRGRDHHDLRHGVHDHHAHHYLHIHRDRHENPCHANNNPPMMTTKVLQ
jgi:hypothetical protein